MDSVIWFAVGIGCAFFTVWFLARAGKGNSALEDDELRNSMSWQQQRRKWIAEQRHRTEPHNVHGIVDERAGEAVVNRTGKRSAETWERDLIRRMQGGRVGKD